MDGARPRGGGASRFTAAEHGEQQHHRRGGEDEHAGAAAELPQRRLAERPVEGIGAGEARCHENDAEHLHDEGTCARGFRQRDDDQRQRRLLDEISLGADRLRQAGNAAIARIDAAFDPVDDHVDRERGAEKAEDGRVKRGDHGNCRIHGRAPETIEMRPGPNGRGLGRTVSNGRRPNRHRGRKFIELQTLKSAQPFRGNALART